MTEMWRLVAIAFAVLAGCSPVVPSPQATPSRTNPTSSAVVPDSSTTAAPIPCRQPQVVMTPGYSGVAAGTAYLRVFVELAQYPPCTLPRSPVIWITSADGAEVARAEETDATPVILDYITGYSLGWNVPCGSSPSGSHVAHIEFSPSLVIDMPIGTFGPSCVDGSRGNLSIIADDPR